MARKIQFYEGGSYLTVPEDEGKVKYFDGANWINAKTVKRFDGSSWADVWEWDDYVPPPSGGTVLLNATSLSIPNTGDYASAQFAVDPYKGNITNARAVISWLSAGSPNTNVYAYGGSSGVYYRNISLDEGWANRTIYHDLSQAVTTLNNGTSKGYLLELQHILGPTYWVGNMRLEVTYS